MARNHANHRRDRTTAQTWAVEARWTHGTRIMLCCMMVAWALYMASPWFAAVGAGALFMAAFAANHDALHGALALPRWFRETFIATAGVMMLASGHAIRVMHLRHHARPLGARDLEGIAATMGFWEALCQTPHLAWAYRSEAFKVASPRDRAFILGETVVNALTLAALLAFGSAPLLAVAATVVLLQLTMPLWAGRIPHRTPDWLLKLARSLAFTRSAVVLSLAYHEEHHRAPQVPCHRLAEERKPRI